MWLVLCAGPMMAVVIWLQPYLYPDENAIVIWGPADKVRFQDRTQLYVPDPIAKPGGAAVFEFAYIAREPRFKHCRLLGVTRSLRGPCGLAQVDKLIPPPLDDSAVHVAIEIPETAQPGRCAYQSCAEYACSPIAPLLSAFLGPIRRCSPPVDFIVEFFEPAKTIESVEVAVDGKARVMVDTSGEVTIDGKPIPSAGDESE